MRMKGRGQSTSSTGRATQYTHMGLRVIILYSSKITPFDFVTCTQTSNLKMKRRENAIHPVYGYENHEDNEEEDDSLVNHGKDRSSPVMVMRNYPLRRWIGVTVLCGTAEGKPEEPL